MRGRSSNEEQAGRLAVLLFARRSRLPAATDARACVQTYLLPGFGEAGDAAWAPISAVLVQALYGSALLSTIDLVEEALPFSDIVPTACIGECVRGSASRKPMPPLCSTPNAPELCTERKRRAAKAR